MPHPTTLYRFHAQSGQFALTDDPEGANLRRDYPDLGWRPPADPQMREGVEVTDEPPTPGS